MSPLISPCPVPGCERPVRRAGLCAPHAREGMRLCIVHPTVPARPHALEILRALDRAARVDELEARLLESDRQREAAAERIAHLEAEVEELTGRILAGAAIHARDAARIAELEGEALLHAIDRAGAIRTLEKKVAELEAEVERARLDGEIQYQAQTAREIEGYARAGDQVATLQAEIERLQEQLHTETERRVAAERNARGADAVAEAVWKLKGRPEVVEHLRTPGMRRGMKI